MTSSYSTGNWKTLAGKGTKISAEYYIMEAGYLRARNRFAPSEKKKKKTMNEILLLTEYNLLILFNLTRRGSDRWAFDVYRILHRRSVLNIKRHVFRLSARHSRVFEIIIIIGQSWWWKITFSVIYIKDRLKLSIFY